MDSTLFFFPTGFFDWVAHHSRIPERGHVETREDQTLDRLTFFGLSFQSRKLPIPESTSFDNPDSTD